MENDQLEQNFVEEVQTTEVAQETSLDDALWGETAEALPEEGEVDEIDPESLDKPKEEEKPEEAIEDVETPPEGLSPKASERFQKLANENKAYKEFGSPEQLASIRDDAQTLGVFRERVIESGMQPDELDKVFLYTKAVKTGDWATAERFLQEQAYQFAVMSGKKLVADPLGAYPDLKQSVEGMTLDEKHAVEMARVRHVEEISRRNQAQQEHNNQINYQQQQQALHVRESALRDVDAMASQWAKNDVLWAEREPLMGQYIEKELVKLPPHTWVAGLQAFYSALQAQPQPPRARTPNSLRPNNMGAASAGAAPKSMGEALWPTE